MAKVKNATKAKINPNSLTHLPARQAGGKNRLSKIRFPLNRVAPVLAIITLLILLYFKKSWFVVAWVNNRPITRFEFNRQLEQQYGKNVLESSINQELINQEAKKQKVNISDEEIQENIEKIEKSLSGQISLDDALKAQGITREQLSNDMKLQLTIEKLVGQGIEISDEEITEYFKENKEFLTATEEGKQKEEAINSLRQQKISEKFQEWLENLRNEVKILRFI